MAKELLDFGSQVRLFSFWVSTSENINGELSVKYVANTTVVFSANPTKWSNTLKKIVGNLPTNCLRVFDHFVILALKGLKARES